MERKEFLKNACLYGFCGCFGMSLLSGGSILAKTAENTDEAPADWRIDFMQNRFRDLIVILDKTVDPETLIKALGQLGATCGNDFAIKYKNNPEGFFDFIKSMWAESVDYKKEEGTITVNEKARESCNCPFVKGKDAPKILCSCSLGTQKHIYQSLFNRPVNVTLNKSVLQGDERCSFTIQLL
jgi:hypothetical protein